jgi:hypothetical protein
MAQNLVYEMLVNQNQGAMSREKEMASSLNCSSQGEYLNLEQLSSE